MGTEDVKSPWIHERTSVAFNNSEKVNYKIKDTESCRHEMYKLSLVHGSLGYPGISRGSEKVR